MNPKVRVRDEATLAATAISLMPDGKARDRAIDRFHSTNYERYQRVAVQFRTRAGINVSEVEDLGQVIALIADAVIRDPKPWRDGHLFEAVLKSRSKSKLRDWSFSSAHTGIGGASGAMRRGMMVARVTQYLQIDLGRAPTTEEIVVEANKEMANRRSNPSKGGKITARDVDGMRVVPHELDPDVLGGYAGSVLPGDCALDPIELAPFARSVIKECSSHSLALGDLAGVYLDQYLNEETSMEPTVKEMAEIVGRSSDWVRRSIHEIHTIARCILSDDLDIQDEGIA